MLLSGGNFNDQLMTAMVIQCTVRYWDLTVLREMYSDICMVDGDAQNALGKLRRKSVPVQLDTKAVSRTFLAL
jgi:hypothetical protein